MAKNDRKSISRDEAQPKTTAQGPAGTTPAPARQEAAPAVQVQVEQGVESAVPQPVAVHAGVQSPIQQAQAHQATGQPVRAEWKPGDPLREDGPTLEEWVAAGYPAAGYPPTGYADKRPKEYPKYTPIRAFVKPAPFRFFWDKEADAAKKAGQAAQ